MKTKIDSELRIKDLELYIDQLKQEKNDIVQRFNQLIVNPKVVVNQIDQQKDQVSNPIPTTTTQTMANKSIDGPVQKKKPKSSAKTKTNKKPTVVGTVATRLRRGVKSVIQLYFSIGWDFEFELGFRIRGM
jgi:hypothetical protein